MGMYDTVMVPCPKCEQLEEFQSKSGPCHLDTYDLGSAPADVLMNVNRHAPATCRKCGTKFEVHVEFITYARSVEWKPVVEEDEA